MYGYVFTKLAFENYRVRSTCKANKYASLNIGNRITSMNRLFIVQSVLIWCESTILFHNCALSALSKLYHFLLLPTAHFLRNDVQLSLQFVDIVGIRKIQQWCALSQHWRLGGFCIPAQARNERLRSKYSLKLT
jgi:hypothetical protein